jgi:hypothetical protein
MHRIFKKKRDLTVSAGRRRTTRCSRPTLEGLEGRQLLSLNFPDFKVNSTQGLVDNSSDTASSPNGLRVVVWEDGFSSTDFDIWAQMYNTDGSKRGGQIPVERNGAFQSHPRVAMDVNGDFVVAWQENTRNIPGNTNPNDYIIAKVFGSIGNALTGRIAVSKDLNTGRTDVAPDVAMDSFGDFTVAWQSLLRGGNGATPQSSIEAAEFDRNGFFLATPFVDTSHGDFQQSPSVAMTPDGRFDIAYQNNVAINFDVNIHLARFDAFARRLSDNALFASQFNEFNASSPNVSMDNSGNAVVAFQAIPGGGSGTAPNAFDIAYERLNSGGFQTGAGSISGTGVSFINNPGFPSQVPDIALDPSGTGMFVVAFDTQLLGAPRGDRTVQLDEVNGNGAIIGVGNLPAFPSNSGAAVSIDGQGGYMMTFSQNGGSFNTSVRGIFGHLPIAPAAKNLALTPTIQAGQSATLTGSLTDAAGNANLTLTVNWGDGSKPQQSKPGTKPFAVAHKYLKPGTYKVHATWSDDHGLANSRNLSITVKPAR